MIIFSLDLKEQSRSPPVHLHLFENSVEVSAGSSRINREALEINRLLVHVVSSNTNSLESVSASLSDEGGLAVGVVDLINCSLSVLRFVLVF